MDNVIIPKIGNDWDFYLSEIIRDNKVQKILKLVELSGTPQYPKEIYPPKDDIFNALKYTSYKDTRVVILGQDPYINPGQAHGFSFSVPVGEKIPPSLMNIYKELHDELGCYIPNNGCLIPWAKQGVLLLNSVLTVEKGKSRSHANLGWEFLTDYIIWALSQKDNSIVFMLWGNFAKQKIPLIDKNSHMILTAAHPSPLAGGAFFGCKHFERCNDYLYEIYPNTIDWQIPNVETD